MDVAGRQRHEHEVEPTAPQVMERCFLWEGSYGRHSSYSHPIRRRCTLGGGIPLLPPPAGRALLKLRKQRKQRVYEKTGTIGLEYDMVRSKTTIMTSVVVLK